MLLINGIFNLSCCKGMFVSLIINNSHSHGITCLRYSLNEIFTHGKIDKENGSILRVHDQEISVVYFRWS